MAAGRDKPTVTSVTPMKNEGPFILEWVAYHRAIGVTDILVFSNDCQDGSDLLLDRLDDLGYLRHYGNPSVIMDGARHHWTVMDYFNSLSRPKRSDWVVSLDADEFICVNTGDGTLTALFDACDGADIITFNQLNYGCSGKRRFDAGELQIDQFTWCQNPTGSIRINADRRGAKSFTRRGTPVKEITNHSPVVRRRARERVKWVNAANEVIPHDKRGKYVKHLDAPYYSYDLVQMNHYAVRSMESFLMQAARGDAVHATISAGLPYWRKYNQNQRQDSTICRWSGAVKSTVAEMLADDELRRLFEGTLSFHRKTIDALLGRDTFQELFAGLQKSHRRKFPQIAID